MSEHGGSSSSAEDSEWSFEDWVVERQFSQKAIGKLRAVNLITLNAICSIRECEIAELKLDLGDRGLFREDWENFTAERTAEQGIVNKPVVCSPEEIEVRDASVGQQGDLAAVDGPAPSESGSPGFDARAHRGATAGLTRATASGSGTNRATTQSLAKDPQLKLLVDKYQSEGLKDLLSFQECVDSKSGEKTKFPYLAITDYIIRDTCVEEEETEEVLSSEALGTKLVLKGRRKKLLPKEITVAQWVGANQRIFAKLYPLFNDVELQEYGEFVEEISEMFSQYPVPNGMRVDDIHRKEVALKGRRWNDIRLFLQVHYLPRNMHRSNPVAVTAGHKNGPSSKDIPSRRICIEFNEKGSCRFGNACRFRHVCSVAGCYEKHAACKHEVPSNSFRTRESSSNDSSKK